MHTNKSLALFIILLWTGFMAWELELQNSMDQVRHPIVRYDLLVLPILMLFTGYAVYVLSRKKVAKKQ